MKIEKGVLMPNEEYVPLLNKMQVGDSFFSPAINKKEIGKIRMSAFRLGFKIATRSVFENKKDGIRVWRVS